MELKIENNKLMMNGKETILTDEQLKELGIELNPFDIKPKDVFYYIRSDGAIIRNIYDGNDFEKNELKAGKICKDKNLMKQKALHQNLNDLLWKFTIENGWSDELWEDNDIKKWSIELREDFSTQWIYRYKSQGTIYFVSEEIAQRAIDEIVKPYMEENPKFVW